MGQDLNQDNSNNELIKPETLKKYITDVDEENLYEISLQLYKFTKLILEKIKDES